MRPLSELAKAQMRASLASLNIHRKLASGDVGSFYRAQGRPLVNTPYASCGVGEQSPGQGVSPVLAAGTGSWRK